MQTAARILFVCFAVTSAGVLQVLWLRSRTSLRFAVPVDGGRTFRGRRLFGDNKTWRGFLGMIAACALCFPVWSWVFPGLWTLPPFGYTGLGAACGLGFMAGELPNSFVKRQLGVPPGKAPKHPVWRGVGWCVDRFDSLIGGLLAIALVVPMSRAVWLGCLVVGPGVHATLSWALYKAGVKKRAQ
jgi:CDP-2,3-bis-(O-geranylgeranyl)-sn-glycerol synthase